MNKLRGFSESCEFGTLRDSLIKDRIALGTKKQASTSYFAEPKKFDT